MAAVKSIDSINKEMYDCNSLIVNTGHELVRLSPFRYIEEYLDMPAIQVWGKVGMNKATLDNNLDEMIAGNISGNSYKDHKKIGKDLFDNDDYCILLHPNARVLKAHLNL